MYQFYIYWTMTKYQPFVELGLWPPLQILRYAKRETESAVSMAIKTQQRRKRAAQ